MSYTCFAEREGFEPPVPRSTTVFKTAAIDHSAISPKLPFKKCFSLKALQRYDFFLNLQTIGKIFFILRLFFIFQQLLTLFNVYLINGIFKMSNFA